MWEETILFLALLGFLLGIVLLITRPFAARNRYLGFVYLILSITVLHGWLIASGEIRSVPHLLSIHIPFMFLIGPLYLRFMRTLIKEEGSGDSFWMDVLPFALAVILFLFGLFIPSSVKIEQAMEFSQTGHAPPVSRLIFASAILWFGIYIFRSIRMLRPYFASIEFRRATSVFAALGILIYAVIVSVLTVLTIFVFHGWYRAMLAGVGLFPPAMMIVSARFPDLAQEFQAAVEKARYEKSRLVGKDIEWIRSEVRRILEEEKLYAEGRLTLEDLSDRLHLSVQALSEFFNQYEKTNFPGYVNKIRIDRACELMEEDPSRTVLSVAFEVGFTAKSTFNSAFLRHKSQSPTAFRKAAQRRKKS